MFVEMKTQNTRCNINCVTTQCHCGLPLNLSHHIQLPCCNFIYHVSCMLNQKNCPNCKCKFNKNTLKYIHHANIQVLQNDKVDCLKKQKRNVFRRYIKEIVSKIIQMRSN